MRIEVSTLRINAFLVVASLGALLTGCQGEPGIYADTVYHNGKIVTVDKDFSVAQAMAIQNDKIVAVGSNDDVLKLAGSQTKRVDLEGHTVVPGLIDDHYHFMGNAGGAFRNVSLVNAASFDEFLRLIKKEADEMPPGEVMTTQSGWLPDQFEGRLPTKEDLDKTAPRNPLFVRGGHTMFLNTAALKMAGITSTTRAPEGGVISRNPETGELTGELVDNAMGLVSRFIPRATYEDKIEGLRRGQKLLHSVGLTSIRDPGIGSDDIRIYQELWDRDELTVRISTNYSLDGDGSAQELVSRLSTWGVHTRFGDYRLRLDGIGEFGIDGGFQAGLMRKPYLESPDVPQHEGDYYGLQRISTKKFTEVIRGLNKLGWRACVHAVGDKGIDVVLDAYEKANQDESIVGKRWTIEHGHVTSPDQFERIKKLGVIISSQFHTFMASRTMIQDWGTERGGQSFRTREWLEAGIKVGVGTDWTLMPPNPFQVLHFLVTRKNRFDELVGPEQKIDRQQALRLATIENAYITFEENIKGSIEPRKLADFVVLEQDYLTIPEDQIKNITVRQTVVGGKVVFDKASN